jgi:hypothetical protein
LVQHGHFGMGHIVLLDHFCLGRPSFLWLNSI